MLLYYLFHSLSILYNYTLINFNRESDNKLCAFFCDHHRWGICISGGNERHNRRINYPQTLAAMNHQAVIDDGRAAKALADLVEATNTVIEEETA